MLTPGATKTKEAPQSNHSRACLFVDFFPSISVFNQGEFHEEGNIGVSDVERGNSRIGQCRGGHSPGWMLISNEYGFMMGTFNVRYNATATAGSSVSAYGYAGDQLHFFGYGNTSFSNVYDAGPGAHFSCYVPTTSSMYSEALAIKNSLGNGSFLSINKDVSTHECTSIMSGKASEYLD